MGDRRSITDTAVIIIVLLLLLLLLFLLFFLLQIFFLSLDTVDHRRKMPIGLCHRNSVHLHKNTRSQKTSFKEGFSAPYKFSFPRNQTAQIAFFISLIFFTRAVIFIQTALILYSIVCWAFLLRNVLFASSTSWNNMAGHFWQVTFAKSFHTVRSFFLSDPSPIIGYPCH